MESILIVYAINLGAIVGYGVLVWLLSLKLKDSSIADIGWGPGFVLIAWLTLWQMETIANRALLLTILISAWGIRLALHIGIRSKGKVEDRRYQVFRQNWGKQYWWGSLFQVFLLQAFLCWAIALGFQTGIISAQTDALSWLTWVGLGIWLFGFLFESIADWQLLRFKSNPQHKGAVMDSGLWRFSRHPNYFGEAVMWWGIFLIVMENPGNVWTIISPIIITYLLLKVSGVTMLEPVIKQSRPEYADYQQRTSTFIPWFPKKD